MLHQTLQQILKLVWYPFTWLQTEKLVFHSSTASTTKLYYRQDQNVIGYCFS